MYISWNDIKEKYNLNWPISWDDVKEAIGDEEWPVSWAEVKTAMEGEQPKPIITFSIKNDGIIKDYQAEAGMTWREWCESEYNPTSPDEWKEEEPKIYGIEKINGVDSVMNVYMNHIWDYFKVVHYHTEDSVFDVRADELIIENKEYCDCEL